jgi:hypothetical protein
MNRVKPMSDPRGAVAAAVILLAGVAAGWAGWQAAYPFLEPVLFARLGPAAGALTLWGLIGPAMAAGFGVAYWAVRWWVARRPGS